MLNKTKNKQVKITPSPEFVVLGHNITLQMQAEIYKRLASPLNGFTLADLRAAIVATLPDLMAKADKYAALDDRIGAACLTRWHAFRYINKGPSRAVQWIATHRAESRLAKAVHPAYTDAWVNIVGTCPELDCT